MLFITYYIKIKGNTPYPLILIEVSSSTIESMSMTSYIMNKKKINNMGDKRLPKIDSYSHQNHLQLR